MAFPALYKRGIAGREYTRTRFAIYMLEGVYQSLVMFYVPYFCYSDGISWSSDGRDTGTLVDFGTTVAVNAIVVGTLGVLANFHAYNIFALLATCISFLAVFVWIPIYSSLGVFTFANTAVQLFSSAIFWFSIPFTFLLAVGPRLLIRAFKQIYIPLDGDIVREAVSYGGGV
jgi:phospholipid-translocating ATPase